MLFLVTFPSILSVVLLTPGLAVSNGYITLELGSNFGEPERKIVFLASVFTQVVEVQCDRPSRFPSIFLDVRPACRTASTCTRASNCRIKRKQTRADRGHSVSQEVKVNHKKIITTKDLVESVLEKELKMKTRISCEKWDQLHEVLVQHILSVLTQIAKNTKQQTIKGI